MSLQQPSAIFVLVDTEGTIEDIVQDVLRYSIYVEVSDVTEGEDNNKGEDRRELGEGERGRGEGIDSRARGGGVYSRARGEQTTISRYFRNLVSL